MHAVTSNAVYDAVNNINDKIPASASSSNKLATAGDVNALFKFPQILLVGLQLPFTSTVDETSPHLVHLNIDFTAFKPTGYKLYKATLLLDWSNSHSYDAYLGEIVGMNSISGAQSLTNNILPFTLYIKNAGVGGETYLMQNQYCVVLEWIKDFT